MRLLILSVAIAAVLAGTGTASAAVFCVNKNPADCPAGSLVRDGDLSNVLEEADNTPSGPHTVFVAPGSYDSTEDTHTQHFATLSNPMTITGAGLAELTQRIARRLEESGWLRAAS